MAQWIGIHTLLVDVGGVIVVNHVVEVGDLALGVGDDGELEVGAGNLVNVLDPLLVGVDVVGTLGDNQSCPLRVPIHDLTHQTDELDTTSSELRLELGEGTELGGTDGGEVILV